MKHTFISKNLEQTLNLGRELAKLLNIGETLLLKGDLGAGKTTITKGIALGLNISEKVNSPTFNIMKLYLKGDKPLFHIDAYRLEGNADDIGLDEFIGTFGICVIEWPQYIEALLPKQSLHVSITHLSLDQRSIMIEGDGQYERIVVALKEIFK